MRWTVSSICSPQSWVLLRMGRFEGGVLCSGDAHRYTIATQLTNRVHEIVKLSSGRGIASFPRVDSLFANWITMAVKIDIFLKSKLTGWSFKLKDVVAPRELAVRRDRFQSASRAKRGGNAYCGASDFSLLTGFSWVTREKSLSVTRRCWNGNIARWCFIDSGWRLCGGSGRGGRRHLQWQRP